MTKQPKHSFQKQKDVTLNEALDEFINYCKIKRLSDKTISWYYLTNYKFISFLDLSCGAVRYKEGVLSYISSFSSSISTVTINTHLRAIRVFLYYCMDCGYIERFKISLIKENKTIKDTYSSNEISKLLKVSPKPSFVEYRTYVAVCVLLGTGCRLSTLLNLKVSDVDFDSGVIKFSHTKQKAEQIVPISSSLFGVLRKYVLYLNDKESFLICSIYGERLSNRTFQKDIERYNNKRGVQKTSVHLFRHTFSKNWILSGGDMFRLQKILGHSTLDMVKNYVNIYSSDLYNNYDEYNPLDNHFISNKKKRHF